MARPLRMEFPNAVYHVVSRGNRKEPVFLDDNDREHFLRILGDTTERYHWTCHGYCLMENHYHLLVETPEANLSAGMRQLNGVYTQRFNWIHKTVGHLFQGRYKALLVEKDSHLLEVMRYIVLNPVRAGIVRTPEEWPWSSYAPTAGLSRKPGFLETDWILEQFGAEGGSRQEAYREFVTDRRDVEQPWTHLQGSIALGSESFLRRVEGMISRKEISNEVPRTERLSGRPSLENLFRNVLDKRKRNAAIHEAHYDYGYSLSDIAEFFGIHYSTVSKILTKERKIDKFKT